MQPDTASILWTDTTLFHSRYEKSSCALVAIKQALERNQVLDGREREFLILYEGISELHSEHFTRVWSDPTTHFWVRVAYELVRNCLTGYQLSPFAQDYCNVLGQHDPKEALAIHLADFKKFVLAARHLAGKDCIFSQPFKVRLPLALPGTRLSLDGHDSVSINALINGRISVSHSGRTESLPLIPGSSSDSQSFIIRECPVVSHNDYELPLQPHSFNIPGLDYAQPALEADFAYQEEHISLVKEALILVERYQPQIYEQFRDFLRLLTLKPIRAGSFTNISNSDLPGAFVCSVVCEPFEFADTLIHEFHHNRLFLIEEISPLLIDTDTLLSDSSYYSPWRDDLRPLRGLLHALYVYLPVCRFWLEVYRGGEVSGSRLDYVRAQIIRISLQLKIAVHQLVCYGQFTEFGRTLFAELKQDVARIHAAVEASTLATDVPAIVCCEDGSFVKEISKSTGQPTSVHKSLLKHIQDFDLRQQCNGILLTELSYI